MCKSILVQFYERMIFYKRVISEIEWNSNIICGISDFIEHLFYEFCSVTHFSQSATLSRFIRVFFSILASCNCLEKF